MKTVLQRAAWGLCNECNSCGSYPEVKGQTVRTIKGTTRGRRVERQLDLRLLRSI